MYYYPTAENTPPRSYPIQPDPTSHVYAAVQPIHLSRTQTDTQIVSQMR